MLPCVRNGAICLVTVLALGCSASSKGAPIATDSTPTNDTWADGKHLAASVTIPFGSSVTIAPGARITVAPGVLVTVQGTLKGGSKAAHAKLGGSPWGGIVVVTGGELDLEGTDLSHADTALSIQGGNASYQYGTIDASGPFEVDKGAKLTVAHATVTGATKATAVIGSFTATFLDYDAATFEGIVGQDDGATISIEDSKLHGTGNENNDLVAARGAATIHVAYTDFAQAHCGFHFDAVTSVDVAHVSIHDGSYGFMLYGSAAQGTRTIASSNIFNNHQRGAEEETQSTVNGLITFTDGYWANNGATPDDNLRQFTGQIHVTNMSTTSPVQGTGPRGAVP
jgi:hypothetical protein